ncbi:MULTISPECIES: acyltransferase family protein [unclassified Arthrobacter]|uniref:acyltransferase family protein n=1 Tax=unclassified Arthrobacter TaxID=235627 RepID=UPI000CE3CF2E|nr:MULTISPECIES: acyltransferase [unclassified Arthrobacter]
MTVGKIVRPQSSTKRIAWMDISRGLAIVLVIIFHSVSEVDKQFGLPEIVVDINNVIAPARMPLMVFLSGLLMGKSIQRSFTVYFGGKAARILWPYFLWSIILMLIVFVGSDPTAFSMDSVLAGLTYMPVDHMWFLRDLFIFYLLSLVLKSLPRSILLILVGVLLVAAELIGNMQLIRFTYLYLFFCSGWAIAHKRDQFESVVRSRVILGICLALSCVLPPIVLHFGDVRYSVIFLPAVAGFAVLVLRFSMCLDERFEWLKYMGRNSLVYYLVHWPVILVLVHAFGVMPKTLDSLLLVFICCVSAFIVCFLAVVCCRPGGPFGFLFEFPRRRQFPEDIDASPGRGRATY